MSSTLDQYLIGVAGKAVIYLALLVPLFALAILTSQRPRRMLPLLLFAAFVTLDIALIYSFKLVRLVPAWGGWNWQGKLLELCWPLVLIAAVPMFSADATGLTFRTARGSWGIVAALCVIYIVLNTPFDLSLGAHFSSRVRLSALVYQATMPGLGEEFAYRGVLLMLLNKSFGRPWRLLGAEFGWGLIIISVMFGVMHGLDIRGFRIHHVEWPEMIYALVLGLVYAWLRERSDSVWPGVAFHNFANVVNGFFV